jgi:hypothetical protein
MRFTFKVAFLSLLLWTVGAVPLAKALADDDTGNKLLVSADQGQAVADFALRSGQRIRPKPDCSHLVHLVYARAGLIYPYEDSRVLYRGVSAFERVKKPQPGDLAVWLGHVGIVLSPEEHTFFSSVHSGILTESWTAAHWVRRGRPRFYRYRIGSSANMDLLAAIMGNETHAQSQSAFSERGPFPASAPPVNTLGEDTPQPGREKTGIGESAVDEASPQSSSVVAVITQRQAPGKRQITEAIIESSNARGRLLAGEETLDLEHPISVFDRVEVTKIKIKHDTGHVTLRLNETMCQETGRVLAGRTMERDLSIVRRDDNAWVISDAQGRTYLPQEHALDIFERQAEIFLRQAPNSSGTRAIVKALDRLYDQQSATPQRAAIR